MVGLADFAGVGVTIDVGRGECLDLGVGVTNGAVATADVGVGVEVIFSTGVAVTRHIHVCISDKPVVAFVAIAETFQVPMTELVFKKAASVTLSFVCTSVPFICQLMSAG